MTPIQASSGCEDGEETCVGGNAPVVYVLPRPRNPQVKVRKERKREELEGTGGEDRGNGWVSVNEDSDGEKGAVEDLELCSGQAFGV